MRRNYSPGAYKITTVFGSVGQLVLFRKAVKKSGLSSTEFMRRAVLHFAGFVLDDKYVPEKQELQVAREEEIRNAKFVIGESHA